MNRDERHLKLLSKIQIIYGIANLFVSYYYYEALFILVHEYRKMLEQSRPELEVALLLGFGFVLLLIGIAILFCIILTGQSLAQHQNYTFCLIVAAAECLIFPIGTIIGISTIWVLRRDSVKTLFATPEGESGIG
ncbi:hypothetical protein [Gimesia aquarii]|uniref:Uncharacterized protein n=1 Tax=Gimesia aquarii TaxID=2527964 RepID=A0A517WT47_9PLAN|nr:hypothetical protein [Gimesia aquarii]QDU08432.1 hypothetical protein V202x_18000 [Gimesia aquarii]